MGGIAFIVALVVYFWPLPFSNIINRALDTLDFSVWDMDVVIIDVDNELDESFFMRYNFSPYSYEFTRILNVLNEHTYRRSFRTYLGNPYALALGPPADYWLDIRLGNYNIITGGLGEIVVRPRFYRMNNASEQAMRAALREIIDEYDSSDQNLDKYNNYPVY